MKMCCVGFNPCIDLTYRIDGLLTVGKVNKAESITESFGGKAYNQARATVSAGGQAVCVCLGKPNFLPDGVKCYFTETSVPIRKNVKICDKADGTDINSPGGPVTYFELCEFFNLIEKTIKTEKCDVLSVSGSLPTVVYNSFPQAVENYEENIAIDFICERISEIVGDLKLNLVVDCSGIFLKKIIELKPKFIKPNLTELFELFGKTRKNQNLTDAVGLCDNLWKTHEITVLCTDGENGSMLVSDGLLYIAKEKRTSKAVRFSGAGDCFFGSFLTKYYTCGKLEESLAFASAAAGEYVSSEQDFPRSINIQNNLKNIEIKKV